MARDTSAGRSAGSRLGLLITCCVLLLAAAGCGGDDSVFTTNPDGSPGTQGTLPGGLIDPGDQGTTGSGGNPGASAAGIPAGAQVYGAFDVGAIPDLMRLVETFEAADLASLSEGLGEGLGENLDLGEGAGEAVEGLEEAEDVLTCLGEELVFDSASVPAWMGDEVALALFDMQFDADTGDTTEPNVLAVVDVADQAAAGAYLQQVVASIGTCTGAAFAETDYQGITVHRADPGTGEPPIAIALIEGYMLAGMGTGMVEGAIDLADGASLADDPNFAEVLAALPTGRHMTGYMGVDLLQQAMQTVTSAAGESGDIALPTGLDPSQALQGMRGLGLAATMLDEGIRLDMVAVGEPNEALPIDGMGAGDLPDLLPADAIAFAGIGAFDVQAAWGGVMEMLAQMPVEEGQPSIEDSLALIGAMLGVDLEEDLINQLTGEIGLGLLPAGAGSLVAGSGVNLGILAVMGVDDPGSMAGTVTALAEGLGRMTEMPTATRPFEGGTLYALSDGTADMVLFGMAGDHMVITTHESHAAALLAGGDKLAGSARFAEAISGLPQGSAPMMYLDIAALVSSLNLEEAEAAALAHLQTLAMTASLGGEVSRMTVFARIDY